jgi:hypothetical protein
LLLLFGISHFGFLTVQDVNHDLRSTVFPFLTNRYLYFSAAVLETIAGVLCLRRRGEGLTNVFILSFVAVIVWYRWAFHYTGGQSCGCLGLLGRLLHVSKMQESSIPVAALGFLVCSTTPWMCRVLRNLLSRSSAVTLVMLLLLQNIYSGAQSITADGVVDLQEYNPGTGAAYADQHSRSTFNVVVSGDSVRFSITNIDRPAWRATFVYDGTNSYTILPFANAARVPFGAASRVLTNTPAEQQQVFIEPSSRLLLRSTENIGVAMLWITFGLCPQSARSNNIGLVEIPMPSADPRSNLGAFGYKWLIRSLPGGRFASSCDILRDRLLDLADARELLRSDLDYPETLSQYNRHMVNLAARKELSSGFLKARYICTESLETNGIVVPLVSKYEVYLSPSSRPRPWRIVNLNVTSVRPMAGGPEGFLPPVLAPTRVIDYRYKVVKNSRIFKYAEYGLEPGDHWRPDKDPVILAQARDWVEHGRKYTSFTSRRSWVAWLLLGLLLAPLVIFTYVRVRQPKGKENQIE